MALRYLQSVVPIVGNTMTCRENVAVRIRSWVTTIALLLPFYLVVHVYHPLKSCSLINLALFCQNGILILSKLDLLLVDLLRPIPHRLRAVTRPWNRLPRRQEIP